MGEGIYVGDGVLNVPHRGDEVFASRFYRWGRRPYKVRRGDEVRRPVKV